jgi:hypothetical protein
MRVLASPEGGLTSIESEVTVRSTSPLFGGLSWASLETERRRGRSQCMRGLVRGGARGPATDQIPR